MMSFKVNRDNNLDKKIVVFLLLILSFVVISCGGDEGGQDRSETSQSGQALANQDDLNRIDKTKKTNVGPQVEIVSPSTGSTVTESTLLIKWTAVDDSGAVPTAELSIRNVNTNEKNTIMPSKPSTGSFPFAGFGALAKGDYEIQLVSSDGVLSNTAFSRVKKP